MNKFIGLSVVIVSVLLCLVGCQRNDLVEGNGDNTTSEVLKVEDDIAVVVDKTVEPVETEQYQDYIVEGESESDWNIEISKNEQVVNSQITEIENSEELKTIGDVYEAEEGSIVNLESVNAFSGKELEGWGYSGSGFVGIFDNTDGQPSELTFEVPVTEEGSYQLIFVCAAPFGDKLNNITVNGQLMEGVLDTKSSNQFMPITVVAELTSGVNKIMVSESWGWIYVDCLIIRKGGEIDTSRYIVDKQLANKNASSATKKLMSYLVDQYGKFTLSGQYGAGVLSPEFIAVKEVTGRYPAIMGLDFIEYSPSRVEHGSKGEDTDLAISWHEMGGIVTFCWHWNAPKDLIDSAETPWWKGFYTEGTTFDFEKALSGADSEGYDLLLRDIDAIAVQLKILQEKDIPVLWRPLHEASGGWFWWGTKGPEAYKKLWNFMFDRLTNYHGINNLIWVFNGQDSDWYPGDDVVDIIGEDIYPAKHDYTSQKNRFTKALDYTVTNKIIALSENGVIPDASLMYQDKVPWSYFCTWEGEFVIDESQNFSETYTEKNLMKKVYNHKKVITYDELPDLSQYPE